MCVPVNQLLYVCIIFPNMTRTWQYISYRLGYTEGWHFLNATEPFCYLFQQ